MIRRKDECIRMKRNEILKSAIARYGKTAQMVVAMEEMAELTKELSKFLRGAHNEDAIAEEIADVRIMLEQLEIMFDCAGAAEKTIGGYISWTKPIKSEYIRIDLRMRMRK